MLSNIVIMTVFIVVVWCLPQLCTVGSKGSRETLELINENATTRNSAIITLQSLNQTNVRLLETFSIKITFTHVLALIHSLEIVCFGLSLERITLPRMQSPASSSFRWWLLSSWTNQHWDETRFLRLPLKAAKQSNIFKFLSNDNILWNERNWISIIDLLIDEERTNCKIFVRDWFALNV